MDSGKPDENKETVKPDEKKEPDKNSPMVPVVKTAPEPEKPEPVGEVRRFKGHTAGVDCVAIHQGRALSSSHDHSVRLWDMETGREIRRFEGHTGIVRSVAFSP